MPPADLRFRVAGTEDADWFEKSGALSLADIARGLCCVDKRLVNQEMPWVTTSSSEGLPPLPYANGTFDLVINKSVMTHLNVEFQDAWLHELRRVTAPGAIVTLTVSGPDVAALNNINDPALMIEGHLFHKTESWKGVHPAFYQNAFHDVSYVFEHWGRFFDIRAYIPKGALNHQDMVVLQRRDGDISEHPRNSLRGLMRGGDTQVFASMPHRLKRRLGWRLLREGLGLRRKRR